MSKIDKSPVRVSGLKVEVVNDKFERAMRQFNKKVQDSGKLQTLKMKERYEKPSERKKREAANAKKRWQRERLLSSPDVSTRR